MSLTWLCNYCPQVFPHFKALLAHYKSEHETKIKCFRLKHKSKGGQAIVYATSLKEACKFLGWDVKDVKETIDGD